MPKKVDQKEYVTCMKSTKKERDNLINLSYGKPVKNLAFQHPSEVPSIKIQCIERPFLFQLYRA